MIEQPVLLSQRWEQLKSYFFPGTGEVALFNSLPFIAYALDQHGVFLWYNQKCRDFFRLPEEPDGKTTIRQFYHLPDERKEFLTRLEKKKEGEWLENTLLDFFVNDEHHYLKDYSRLVKDNEGNLLGLVSVMINVTKEERYHQLFENLPIGIFRFLNTEEGLVYANEKFVKMHGYDDLDEIRKAPVGKFVADKETARQLIEEVRTEGRLIKKHIKHRRKDDSIFWGSINAIAIRDESGTYLGTEGTVVDVTMEGLYNELINLVPIGLFKVEINSKGEHLLVHCNDAFAQNLNFKSSKDLINRDIRQFHDSDQGFDVFYQRLIHDDTKGLKDSSYIIRSPDSKGEMREYQIYPRLEKDSAGNIIGRVGAQRDVTDERKLQKRLDEIRSDFGQVLHAYSTTLVMAKTNFEAVLLALGSYKANFERGMFQERAVFEQIDAAIRSIRTITNRLKQEPDMPEPAFSEACRLTDLLKEVSGLETVNQHTAMNNEAAVKLLEILDEKLFSKEKIRPLRRALDELVRNTSVIFLHRGLEGILEMEAPVHNLRSYLIDGIKPQEEPAKVDIYEVLLDVIKNLFSYASYRGIEIKYHLREIQNVYLRGHELELKRAFTNLLHNSIKYSWTRKTGNIPYVDIEAKKDAGWLVITLVNRGVGISRKEIAEGRIFEFGYRGEKSSDRRRPGTGIGLYDAKIVMEAHRGTLQVDSRPVYGNPEIEQSTNQPYITTVTCRIPISPSNNAL